MVMSIESVEQQRSFGKANKATLRARQRTAKAAALERKRLALIRMAEARLAGAGKPTIRAAAITTPGKAIAVRAVSKFLGPGRGQQVQGIMRQRLGGIPTPLKVVGGAVGVTALSEGFTGQSPIPLARGLLLRGGRAFGERSLRQSTGGKTMAGSNLAVGGILPPSHQVVRTWQTFPGGPVFARLADGHIAVQKKDGTIKHFRPYRPVVIPRRWNARSMGRVATALKRQRKTATKIMKMTGGMPKGRS